MAGNKSLGTLTLDLIAKIGGFEAGLGKAEREAEKRAKAIQKVFDKAGTAAGVAFGTAVTAAIAGAAVFDRLIKQVGDFQDIAEKTGGSAEGFASFAVSAAVANVEINTLAAASVRLTKGLTGVDDESKAAGAAIQALGLDLGKFKDLAPEDQIESVAKALGGFEDGASKTAVAVALFGKAGADLLPFLKELEQQGGRQVVLTAEQIKMADEYADRQARATAQLNQYAQAIAVQALPALTIFTTALKETIQEIVNLESATQGLSRDEAVQEFAKDTAVALATMVDGIANAVKAFKALYSSAAVLAQLTPAAMIDGISRGAADYVDRVKKSIQDASKDVDALSVGFGFADRVREGFNRAAKDKTFAKSIEAEAKRLEALNGGSLDATPRLNFAGGVKADKAGGAAKQSEADRYIESLQKQLEKTQDLTVADQVLLDIQKGRLGSVTEAQKEQILLTARQIDAAREFEQVLKDRRAASIAEGDAVTKVNEAYQSRLKTLLDATASSKLQKDREDARLLTEEFEAGRLTEEKYLEALTARFDLVGEKINETNTFAKDLGLTFTSAFEDAVSAGKSFGDVLKGLGADLLRLGTRKFVTEPFGNAIDGALKNALSMSSGGFDYSQAAAAGVDFMFRAAGGPVSAGSPYIVGERGPELMVPSQSGTVVPNHALGVTGGSSKINFAPVIHIDARADIGQIQKIVDRQMRASEARLVDNLNIQGRI
ncbi:MAG: hypothetical protein V4718_04530 [Pseudomonadota bacterium]